MTLVDEISLKGKCKSKVWSDYLCRLGGSRPARENPLDMPTELLDPEERQAMVGGAFAQAMQRQSLESRKERMSVQKE